MQAQAEDSLGACPTYRAAVTDLGLQPCVARASRPCSMAHPRARRPCLEFGHLGGVFQAAALRVALAIGEE